MNGLKAAIWFLAAKSFYPDLSLSLSNHANIVIVVSVIASLGTIQFCSIRAEVWCIK